MKRSGKGKTSVKASQRSPAPLPDRWGYETNIRALRGEVKQILSPIVQVPRGFWWRVKQSTFSMHSDIVPWYVVLPLSQGTWIKAMSRKICNVVSIGKPMTLLTLPSSTRMYGSAPSWMA